MQPHEQGETFFAIPPPKGESEIVRRTPSGWGCGTQPFRPSGVCREPDRGGLQDSGLCSMCASTLLDFLVVRMRTFDAALEPFDDGQSHSIGCEILQSMSEPGRV